MDELGSEDALRIMARLAVAQGCDIGSLGPVIRMVLA